MAVSGTLLERSIERNLVLVSATRLRISRAPIREEGSGKAKVRLNSCGGPSFATLDFYENEAAFASLWECLCIPAK